MKTKGTTKSRGTYEITASLGFPASGYALPFDLYPFVYTLNNMSGWNQATNTNDGRTAAVLLNLNVNNGGQGDCMAILARGTVTGERVGSTHFLANPAASLLAGDIFAGSDGVYLNPFEVQLHDNGHDAAAITYVTNLDRTNDTGAKEATWGGFRAQSIGTKAIDFGLALTGPVGRCLDFTGASTVCAMVTLPGQRIYMNGQAGAFFSPNLGDAWIEYDANRGCMAFVVDGAEKMRIYTDRIEVTVPVQQV